MLSLLVVCGCLAIVLGQDGNEAAYQGGLSRPNSTVQNGAPYVFHPPVFGNSPMMFMNFGSNRGIRRNLLSGSPSITNFDQEGPFNSPLRGIQNENFLGQIPVVPNINEGVGSLNPATSSQNTPSDNFNNGPPAGFSPFRAPLSSEPPRLGSGNIPNNPYFSGSYPPSPYTEDRFVRPPRISEINQPSSNKPLLNKPNPSPYIRPAQVPNLGPNIGSPLNSAQQFPISVSPPVSLSRELTSGIPAHVPNGPYRGGLYSTPNDDYIGNPFARPPQGSALNPTIPSKPLLNKPNPVPSPSVGAPSFGPNIGPPVRPLNSIQQYTNTLNPSNGLTFPPPGGFSREPTSGILGPLLNGPYDSGLNLSPYNGDPFARHPHRSAINPTISNKPLLNRPDPGLYSRSFGDPSLGQSVVPPVKPVNNIQQLTNTFRPSNGLPFGSPGNLPREPPNGIPRAVLNDPYSSGFYPSSMVDFMGNPFALPPNSGAANPAGSTKPLPNGLNPTTRPIFGPNIGSPLRPINFPPQVDISFRPSNGLSGGPLSGSSNALPSNQHNSPQNSRSPGLFYNPNTRSDLNGPNRNPYSLTDLNAASRSGQPNIAPRSLQSNNSNRGVQTRVTNSPLGASSADFNPISITNPIATPRSPYSTGRNPNTINQPYGTGLSPLARLGPQHQLGNSYISELNSGISSPSALGIPPSVRGFGFVAVFNSSSNPFSTANPPQHRNAYISNPNSRLTSAFSPISIGISSNIGNIPNSPITSPLYTPHVARTNPTSIHRPGPITYSSLNAGPPSQDSRGDVNQSFRRNIYDSPQLIPHGFNQNPSFGLTGGIIPKPNNPSSLSQAAYNVPYRSDISVGPTSDLGSDSSNYESDVSGQEWKNVPHRRGIRQAYGRPGFGGRDSYVEVDREEIDRFRGTRNRPGETIVTEERDIYTPGRSVIKIEREIIETGRRPRYGY